MDNLISKKIILLNQTTLSSLEEDETLRIIENFTETGMSIMEADYGFAWWRSKDGEKYHLAYKSKNTPYEPKLPRERGGNFEANENKMPVFIEAVKIENYDKEHDVSRYMKSYVIIPITHDDFLYGNLVLCYKKEHVFTEEYRGLAVALGNATAQAITGMTLRKKLEVLRETEILFAEEKLKTEFIANATHEIRTPLTIIRGNVDLARLKKSTDKKFINGILSAINHEVEHLSYLMSDLTLLISDKGKVEERITNREVHLDKLIKHLVGTFKILADKKKISIKLNNIPQIVIPGDESYIEKLFANLIKNAITYGKKGGWISIKVKDGKENVEVKVCDNGIGISKEDLPNIFHRFYKADKSHGLDSKRFGLGLAIVKWVVTVHGGEVSAESEENKGTTFTVILPH